MADRGSLQSEDWGTFSNSGGGVIETQAEHDARVSRATNRLHDGPAEDCPVAAESPERPQRPGAQGP